MKKALFAFLLGTLLFSAPAHADGMSDGEPVTPLDAALVFCATYPLQCKRTPDVRTAVEQSEVRDVVPAIQQTVNFQIRPHADPLEVWVDKLGKTHFVPGEVWTVIPKQKGPIWGDANRAPGDCDDYAVTKRARLLELGFPSGALRLARVLTEESAFHMVLVIVIKGHPNLVLDNRRIYPVEWKQLPYLWIEWQSASEPTMWVEIVTEKKKT